MHEDEDEANEEDDDGEKKNILASLVTGFVSRLLKPLQDFGFGRTRLWEGGVGLFMISGVGLAFIIWGWIQGLLSFARKNSYQAFIEFPVACGIQVGTNVRIRGVKAGTVLSVQPSLEKVEVLVEMDDKNVPIPRNSLIEANQSGLIAETIIDITPATPIPVAQWGPLDSGCEGEGLIVCDRGKIKGHQGVSMDELVGICTKLAREMERQNGMHKMFDTTETARNMMLTLQPLLREAAVIAQELRPMMQGVNEQGTLDTLESLAGKTSATVEDIRKLKDAILTEENQELLRQSISTLTKTLQHIEKVSGDISSVSGDPSTRANLRHLIQSLSRLVDA
jgi:ABC-type transporter Mla subunit MlaD